MRKNFLKLFRSLAKIVLPFLYKILIKLKINRRVINFLSEKGYKSNNTYNFGKLIKDLIINEKIISLDVGAQGGFNSDNFFQVNIIFFENILVEPINPKRVS